MLLDRQLVLLDKRNQEKGRYYFAIQTALVTDVSLKNDSDLAMAKRCLGRDSFERQSVNYTVTIKSNGDKEFIRKGYNHSPTSIGIGND